MSADASADVIPGLARDPRQRARADVGTELEPIDIAKPALRQPPKVRRRKVDARGVERVDEFRAMAECGVDMGQGFYFGQPTERQEQRLR